MALNDSQLLAMARQLFESAGIEAEIDCLDPLFTEAPYLELSQVLFPEEQQLLDRLESLDSPGLIIEALIKFIGQEVLGRNLSHISGRAISFGDKGHLGRLLELLLEVVRGFMDAELSNDNYETLKQPIVVNSKNASLAPERESELQFSVSQSAEGKGKNLHLWNQEEDQAQYQLRGGLYQQLEKKQREQKKEQLQKPASNKKAPRKRAAKKKIPLAKKTIESKTSNSQRNGSSKTETLSRDILENESKRLPKGGRTIDWIKSLVAGGILKGFDKQAAFVRKVNRTVFQLEQKRVGDLRAQNADRCRRIKQAGAQQLDAKISQFKNLQVLLQESLSEYKAGQQAPDLKEVTRALKRKHAEQAEESVAQERKRQLAEEARFRGLSKGGDPRRQVAQIYAR